MATQPASKRFIMESQKGIAFGVPTLGSDGKVPLSQLPTMSTTPTNPGTGTGSGGIGVRVSDFPGWSATPGANNTAAFQAAVNHCMAGNAARLIVPNGTTNVTNIVIDYATQPIQPNSGEPYGYKGFIIEGESQAGTIIKQIDGTTGDVFAVTGRLGTQSGPGTNNKVFGFRFTNLTIEGNASGRHGIRARSIIGCHWDHLVVRLCGGSGIKIEREYFVSGQNDEYGYALSLTNVRLVENVGSGFETTGFGAIGAILSNVEAIKNGIHGFKITPTNMTLIACQAIGNGIDKVASRGLLQTWPTSSSSVSSALNLIGFRSEGNSGVGGYEVEIQGIRGGSIFNPNFFATEGAHCLGLGLVSGLTVNRFRIVGGFWGIRQDTAGQSGQKCIVMGVGAVRPHLDLPWDVDNGPGSKEISAVVTLGQSVAPTMSASVAMA